MTGSRAPLLWWVAAFVVHRALLIALGFDGIYFWEETYRLLIAEALRGGWAIPLHDLQADPYAGGSVVFAGLTALVSAVSGPSIVALKAVALAWSALGLWLWLLMADNVFGRRTAHVLGLVWLAAPPVFAVFNVVGQGFHSDTVTLSGLQWLLMYRYVARSTDRSIARARLFAWMAVAGLSIWFSYASALTFVAAAAYALAAGALPLRSWPLAAAGFAAGFSPWIVRYAVAGGALDIVGETFARGGAGRAGYMARLFDVTVHGVPVALYFRNIGVPGDVKVSRDLLAYPYLAICAAAWIAATSAALLRIVSGIARSTSTLGAHVRQSPELAILVVFPLFLATIAASNQEFNDYGMVRWFTFRIIVPALPSLFFAVALVVARAPRPLGIAALSVCVAAGVVGTLQIVNDGSGRRAFVESEARETGAEAYGHLVVFKHGTDPVFGPRIDALPPELRARAYRGVGFSFAYLFGTRRSDASASGLTKALLSVDPEYRAAAIEGARAAIREGLEQVAPLPPSPRRDELAAAIDQAEAAPREAPSLGSLASLAVVTASRTRGRIREARDRG